MKYLFLLMGACIMLGSCSTGDAASTTAAKVFAESSQALIFLDCRAAAEQRLEFTFSHPVTIKSLNFSPELAVGEIQGGATVKIMLDEIPDPGVLVTADLLAEDEKRNSINVIVTFRTRNNRMPNLLINEVRTEYLSSSKRTEFIELIMKSPGNLGAMRIFMAGSSQKPSVYEFAPVEVANGELVVLHLRTIEADKDICINEYGSLSESGGTDSSSEARDFWVPGTAVKPYNKTGYIYAVDQDDTVLDAVMFSENSNSWWAKDYLANAAEFLFNKGAWKAPEGGICSPADALNTAEIKTAATRSISRDKTAEDTNTANDWFVTATSGATPGKPNVSRP